MLAAGFYGEKMDKAKKIVIWIPAILIAMMIFGVSGQNGEQSQGLSYKVAEILVDGADALHLIDMKYIGREHAIERMQTPVRKIAHMTEYAILALSVYIALVVDGLKWRWTKYATLFIIFAYACTDEIHQLFIAGRNGSFVDVLIDVAGGLIAILICMMCDKRRKIVI